MLEIDDLLGVVFSELSALVIEGVEDENDLIRVMARTRDEPAPCPVCGALTGRVHGWCSRTVTDVPIDGRRVVISLQVRRLVCPARGCPQQTFREQVPGLLERRHRYATILTDAETGERIDVLPGRGADALQSWLRTHPGAQIVCRDGSGAYGEAIRRGLPDAVQVSDSVRTALRR